MADEDGTEQASAGAVPTTELDPAETAGVAPLAYSDHTTSMPVIDYQPPRLRPAWIIALVLAGAGAVAAAMFMLGRTTAPESAVPAVAVPPASSSAPTTPPIPVAAAPPPAPAPVIVPPPVTVTVTPTTTSVPPLATPQARIAEPMICSLHNQYPQMQPVDLALSLVERNIYNTYDEAQLVVDLVLKDGCHGI